MKAYRQFIGGSLRKSKPRDVIEVENPFTGKIVSTVPNGGCRRAGGLGDPDRPRPGGISGQDG